MLPAMFSTSDCSADVKTSAEFQFPNETVSSHLINLTLTNMRGDMTTIAPLQLISTGVCGVLTLGRLDIFDPGNAILNIRFGPGHSSIVAPSFRNVPTKSLIRSVMVSLARVWTYICTALTYKAPDLI